MELIANRRYRARHADGSESGIELGIGRPVQAGPDDWTCAVRLTGLHPSLSDQHGVDAWQALMLAQDLLRMLLEGFVAEGGVLLDADSGEPVTAVEDIFRAGL